MSRPSEPVVLELAPLPREQIGPFLLLGLDKDADKEAIEANWARRVIWARKGQTRIALEDINWAREAITDSDRRVRADCASFNIDTGEGLMRRLLQRAGAGSEGTIGWEPLDAEKAVPDTSADVEVPHPDEVRAALTLPELPFQVPAVARLLDEAARAPIDPWALDLPLP